MNHPDHFVYEYKRIDPRWEGIQPRDYPTSRDLEKLQFAWNTAANDLHLPEALAFICLTLGQPVPNKRLDDLHHLDRHPYHLFVTNFGQIDGVNQAHHGAFTNVVVTEWSISNPTTTHNKDGAPLALYDADARRFVQWVFGIPYRPMSDIPDAYNSGSALIELRQEENLYIPAAWENTFFALLDDARRVHAAAVVNEDEAARRAMLERLLLT